jgi:hypothetical protein
MNSDEKRGIERFRRVKEEEVSIDERVVDNSFEAKVSVLKRFETCKVSKLTGEKREEILRCERKLLAAICTSGGKFLFLIPLRTLNHFVIPFFVFHMFSWSTIFPNETFFSFLFMKFSDAP